MSKELLYCIILNYNGWKNVIQNIESIKKCNYGNYRILVVDNHSHDGSLDCLKERYAQLEYFDTGGNLGFAGGMNMGIDYALRHGAEYLCLLNDDVIVDADAFSIMIEDLRQHPGALCGPSTLFWGTEQIHSAGLSINYIKGRSNIIGYREKWEDYRKDSYEVEHLEGTCLMFHRDLIRDVGKLPEVYFLYYEETEWCVRACRRGYQCRCVPKAKIWHMGSATAGKNSPLKIYFDDRNRFLFVMRNAPLLSKGIFILYYYTQLAYRVVTRKRPLRAFRASVDGIRGAYDKGIMGNQR